MKVKTFLNQSQWVAVRRKAIDPFMAAIPTRVAHLLARVKRLKYNVKDKTTLLYYKIRGLTYFKTIVWIVAVFMITLGVISCVTLLQEHGYFPRLPEIPNGVPVAYQAALFTIMIPIYLLAELRVVVLTTVR